MRRVGSSKKKIMPIHRFSFDFKYKNFDYGFHLRRRCCLLLFNFNWFILPKIYYSHLVRKYLDFIVISAIDALIWASAEQSSWCDTSCNLGTWCIASFKCLSKKCQTKFDWSINYPRNLVNLKSFSPKPSKG